jgi:hypothetical protein
VGGAIDFNQLGAMLARLTTAHSDRMAALGLEA